MSKATRRELAKAISERCRWAWVDTRSTILYEFVAMTGYHRKHAIPSSAASHLLRPA